MGASIFMEQQPNPWEIHVFQTTQGILQSLHATLVTTYAKPDSIAVGSWGQIYDYAMKIAAKAKEQKESGDNRRKEVTIQASGGAAQVSPGDD